MKRRGEKRSYEKHGRKTGGGRAHFSAFFSFLFFFSFIIIIIWSQLFSLNPSSNADYEGSGARKLTQVAWGDLKYLTISRAFRKLIFYQGFGDIRRIIRCFPSARWRLEREEGHPRISPDPDGGLKGNRSFLLRLEWLLRRTVDRVN